MPRAVSEIPSGNQVSRSSSEGTLADAATRVFRIVLQEPNESFGIQEVCGIAIGDAHPLNDKIFCNSISGRFEGDSRMVYLVTFEYQSTPSQSNSQNNSDPRNQPPNIRPANWSISSSSYEAPIWSWIPRLAVDVWGVFEAAANGANDMYDGVTSLDTLTTISVQQFEATDPARHARYVGSINKDQLTLGSLVMDPHTVMLRGISSQPVVESWGDQLFRGWSCTYELAYKENIAQVFFGNDVNGAERVIAIGWDVAVPQTGFNVKTFAPANGRAIDDPFGQPLKHDEQTRQIDTSKPLELPTGMAVDKRARAMVQVFSFNGGVSQSPSAQPIALNDNGRPRSPDLTPIVRAYQVHPSINFINTLQLRFT
jgi:hypothetical protein